MPTSATLRIQGGRPPSTRPVPCSTLEASIAPNIQLAGKFISRSNSATAIEAAISAIRPAGEAIAAAKIGGADGATPVSTSTSGNAAVRMITRRVCTTAIAGDIRALLGGEDGDLRQRAGAAGEKRRGLVPAVKALQIKAAAEGRAEGRQRQQADGQRIGAHMLDQLPRHQRAQRNPEQQQHRLGQDRRQMRAAGRPARRCRPRSSRRKSARPAGWPTGTAGRRRRRSQSSPLRAALRCGLGGVGPAMSGSGFTPPYGKSAPRGTNALLPCSNAACGSAT